MGKYVAYKEVAEYKDWAKKNEGVELYCILDYKGEELFDVTEADFNKMVDAGLVQSETRVAYPNLNYADLAAKYGILWLDKEREAHKKEYDRAIDYDLRFMIGVTKTLKALNDVEFDFQEDTDIVAEDRFGNMVRYNFDKIRYTTKLNTVQLHVFKKNRRKADEWVVATDLYGYRLDLVFNRIIWEI